MEKFMREIKKSVPFVNSLKPENLTWTPHYTSNIRSNGAMGCEC